MTDMFDPNPSPPKKKARRSLASSTTLVSSPAGVLPVHVHSIPVLLRPEKAAESPDMAVVKKKPELLTQMSRHPEFEPEESKPQFVISQGENPGIIVRPGYQTIVPFAETPDPFGRVSLAIEFKPELHAATMPLSDADVAFFGVEKMTVGKFWKVALRAGLGRPRREFLSEKHSTYAYDDLPLTNGVLFELAWTKTHYHKTPHPGFLMTQEQAFPILCALYENAMWQSPDFLKLVERANKGEKLVIADGLIVSSDVETYKEREYVRGYVGSPDMDTVVAAFDCRDGKFGIGNALLARNTSMAFILYIMLLMRDRPEMYPWRLSTFRHWLPFDVPRSTHAKKLRTQIELKF
jgi:hypothetical protein